jgi:putative colanic acid biosynthesis glycosyltransferase
MPRLSFYSIITASYNDFPGLQKTAHSLSAQTCRDFEWIVIDGGSTDGTVEFLQNYEGWISEPDHGLYDAMNKGIKRAGGEYFLFLNAGDMLADVSTLEKIKAEAKNLPDFIYGDSFEDGRYKTARNHNFKNWGMFTHHQAMLYRRAVASDMHYETSYKIGADYDFTCRFLNKAEKILYLPFPICIFETGGLSQQNAKEGRREQFFIRKKFRANIWKNNFIYYAQSCIWILRNKCPGLYWRLKSSGNSGNGRAQT